MERPYRRFPTAPIHLRAGSPRAATTTRRRAHQRLTHNRTTTCTAHHQTVAPGQTRTPHLSMMMMRFRQAAMAGIAHISLNSTSRVHQARDLTREMMISTNTLNLAIRLQVEERQWAVAGTTRRACRLRETLSRVMIARVRTRRTPTGRSCNSGEQCLLHPHRPVDYFQLLLLTDQHHHGCHLTRASVPALFPHQRRVLLYAASSALLSSTLCITPCRTTAGVVHLPCQRHLSTDPAVQANPARTCPHRSRCHHRYPLVRLG